MLISEFIAHFGLQTASPLTSDFEIRGVRPLDRAGPGDLSFLSNAKYRSQAEATRASALLIKEPMASCKAVQILCKDPYVVLARALQHLYPETSFKPGVHPSAVVDPTVQLGPACHIGPFCVLRPGTRIGTGTVLVSHVSVGADCRLGSGVRLFPQVVLYDQCQLGDRVRIHANTTIGSDGFGYAQEGGKHHKVPQIGRVILEDDVEIGANSSIDRGALGDTVIGKGTKIDNQVQIAHGVVVGKHSILVSQTGISGSATVGEHNILAGKVGVTGHVKIGDRVLVMGDSVVTKNLKGPGRYAGNPAIPHIQYQRQLAQIRMLPELKARVKALENVFREEPSHD